MSNWTTPAATPDVIGIPTPGFNNEGGDPNAQKLLTAMGAATTALGSATYEGVMYCRGGKGNRPKALADLGGEWEATTVYQTGYKRGDRYRIDVTKCTNPVSVGMSMAVEHSQAHVKLPGVLGFLPISLDLGDSKMLNFRGHRLDVGSLSGLGKRFGAGDPTARFVGGMSLDGATLDVVEMPHAPSFDKTIAKEVLGIDKVSHLIRYHAMYTAERKVYEMKMLKFKPNASVSDSRFEL